jgi:hypothetical protein
MTTDMINEQLKALSDIADADAGVRAAKRTYANGDVTGAATRLHAAVDHARELDVEWGRIGAVLGIARGCAYQRYRKHLGERSRVGAA